MTSRFTTKKKNILELDKRRRIYNIVNKHAGSHFREIERISKLSTGSVKYHLDFLSKHSLIREEKEDNNLRYFPLEFNTGNIVLLGLLRQKSIRKILIYLLQNNNSSHEEIVNFTALSPSTISWHLKKLLRKGIIKVKREGKKTLYNLTIDADEIINLLITYQESFLDSLVNKTIEMWDIN